jgi:hypothetical protein
MTSALQPGTPPADPTRTPTPDRDARGLPTTVTQTDPESNIPSAESATGPSQVRLARKAGLL